MASVQLAPQSPGAFHTQTCLAVVGRRLGCLETFGLEPLDPGSPGPGEVRVRVQAAAVSFVGTLLCEGRYQVKPPLPYVPGTEFAGLVEATGPGVNQFKIGDLVCASGTGGGMRQALILPESDLSRAPAGFDASEAACFRVNYLTVFYGLHQRASLQPGETVLVLGAAGGIGMAAVQMATAMEARVIALASSPAKRDLAISCGAMAALDSRSPDWREQVKALTGPQGVDVVVDPVGGEVTETAFRCLGWGGRHLVIGFAAGTIPALPTNLALLKGASLVGVDILQLSRKEPVRASANWTALMQLAVRADLRPRIAARYPLPDFVAAMRAASGGQTAGRIIIDMGL